MKIKLLLLLIAVGIANLPVYSIIKKGEAKFDDLTTWSWGPIDILRCKF